MGRRGVFTAVVALCLLGATQSAIALRKTGPLYVTLALTPHVSRLGVSFSGTTNLPNGTLLMFAFASKAYTQLAPYADASRYYYMDQKLWVQSGRVHTRTFTFRGHPFPKGSSYRASVQTPFPGIEPAQVQAVFGPHGDNLRGPLVTRDLGQNLVEPPSIWITIP
jgi:hypothetical protein